MPPTPIQAFLMRGWTEGWRPDLADAAVNSNAVTDVLDMEWTEGMGLRKRPGFRKITTDVTDQDTAEFLFANRVYTTLTGIPNFIQHLFYFDEDSGHLWRQTFGEIIEEDQLGSGSNFADTQNSMGVASPTAVNYFRVWPIATLTYNSYIYVTALRYNGYTGTKGGAHTPATDGGGATDSTKPIRYDAQAGTFTRPTVHSLDGSTSGFPRARCALTKYDRVFVANVHDEGVFRYPSRIYWSDAGTSETFQSNSYIDVGADDGSEITALVPFGESIIIFKNNSVWSLTGTDEDTFALYQLDDKIGTEATYGAWAEASQCFFFDYRKGVYSYDGARFQRLSDHIDSVLLEGINREAAHKSVVQVHDERLYVSVPWNEFSTTASDHNTVTFVLDLNLGTWTRWSTGFIPFGTQYLTDFSQAGVAIKGTNDFYVGGIKDSVGVMAMQSGYADDVTTNFQPAFQTAWLNPGELGDRHRIRRFEILTSADTGDFTVTLRKDFKTDTWGSFTYDPAAITGNYEQILIAEQGLSAGEWFVHVKFKIDGVSDEYLQVDGIGLTLSSRRLLRGAQASADYTA